MENAIRIADPVQAALSALGAACGRHKARTAALAAVLAVTLGLLWAPHPAFAGFLGDLGLKNVAESLLKSIQSEMDLLGATNLLTAPFDQLFGKKNTGGTDIAQVMEAVWEKAALPCATTVLSAIFVLQLLNIAQRMEGSGAMPGVKDVIFLLVFYCVFVALLSNSFGFMQAIYEALNQVTKLAQSATNLSTDTSAVTLKLGTEDDAALVMIILFSILSWVIGLIAVCLTYVILWARAFQIYVMAALSPIPLALLGNDNTRQMGVGYLKSFCAICLASLIIFMLFSIYPLLVANAVNTTAGALTFTADLTMSMIKYLAVSVLYLFALVKSGSWAQAVLGG